MREMTLRRGVPILLFVLLAAACDRDGGPEPVHTGSPALNAAQAPLLPKFTESLPDLNVDGYRRLLSQLQGTPVVVNVWASWCVPCRAEAPLLAGAARRHGANVQFVGIDIKDSRGGAQDFIAEFGWPYPSFFDPPGSIATELGLLGPPGTFLYDRTGRLVESVPGQISGDRLEQGIRAILR